MKLSSKQKYTLYIGVILIALMALFVHEFLNTDIDFREVDNKVVEIYY